jgi:hypothetical protein
MFRTTLPLAILSILTGITLAACGAPSIESEDVATESSVEDSESAVVTNVNLCKGQPANTFHCIDDTRFQQCIGGDQFVVNSCPPGFCATRHPASKNPCVGAARALEIDGVPPTPAGQLFP